MGIIVHDGIVIGIGLFHRTSHRFSLETHTNLELRYSGRAWKTPGFFSLERLVVSLRHSRYRYKSFPYDDALSPLRRIAHLARFSPLDEPRHVHRSEAGTLDDRGFERVVCPQLGPGRLLHVRLGARSDGPACRGHRRGDLRHDAQLPARARDAELGAIQYLRDCSFSLGTHPSSSESNHRRFYSGRRRARLDSGLSLLFSNLFGADLAGGSRA